MTVRTVHTRHSWPHLASKRDRPRLRGALRLARPARALRARRRRRVVLLSFALVYRREAGPGADVTARVARRRRAAARRPGGRHRLCPRARAARARRAARQPGGRRRTCCRPLLAGRVGRDAAGRRPPSATSPARSTRSPRSPAPPTVPAPRRLLIGRSTPLAWPAARAWWIAAAVFFAGRRRRADPQQRSPCCPGSPPSASWPTRWCAPPAGSSSAPTRGTAGPRCSPCVRDLGAPGLVPVPRRAAARLRRRPRRAVRGLRGRVVGVLLLLVSVSFDGLLSTPQWGTFSAASAGWGGAGHARVRGASRPHLRRAHGGDARGLRRLRARRRPGRRAAGTTSLGALTGLLPSLLPIAYGYLLAHYLQYILVNGQLLFPLLGNPVGSERLAAARCRTPSTTTTRWRRGAADLGRLVRPDRRHRARPRRRGRPRAPAPGRHRAGGRAGPALGVAVARGHGRLHHAQPLAARAAARRAGRPAAEAARLVDPRAGRRCAATDAAGGRRRWRRARRRRAPCRARRGGVGAGVRSAGGRALFAVRSPPSRSACSCRPGPPPRGGRALPAAVHPAGAAGGPRGGGRALRRPARRAPAHAGAGRCRAGSFPLWASVVTAVAVAEEMLLRGALWTAARPARGGRVGRSLGADDARVRAAARAALRLGRSRRSTSRRAPARRAADGVSGGWGAPAVAHTLADLAGWWLR